MSEFEEKLESILSDPHAMEQIMSLAQSLGGTGSPPPYNCTPSGEQTAPAGITELLGQLDPGMVSRIFRLLSQSNGNDDQRLTLLHSLRPFLREERYAKLDKAIQIARLSRLIRMALELFRTKEDSHV